MTSGGYDAFDDPYSYQQSNCLKNRLGLRDSAVLQAFELEMSTLRALEPLPMGRFGAAHYCAVHRHLFQDVYSWAGRYRTVRTAKDGNWFCFPEYIRAEMDRLFGRLQLAPFVGSHSPEAFIRPAADFLAELNAIHPFREGNGRAQLSFLYLVAIRAGHRLALDAVERETFMPAMIESYHGRLNPLVEQMTAMLRDP